MKRLPPLPTTLVVIALAGLMARDRDDAAARGAEVITEPLVRKHVSVIADDSMMGRDTPSPGLEKTARYIAENFKRVGLAPGGDAGSYLQRYRIGRRPVDPARSSLQLRLRDIATTLSFKHDVVALNGGRSGHPVAGAAILFGGRYDSAAIARVDVAGKVPAVVVDWTNPTHDFGATLLALERQRPLAIVLLSNVPTREFNRQLRHQFTGDSRSELGSDDSPPLLEIREGALDHLLAAAGIDLAGARASRQPIVRPLPDLAIEAVVSEVAGEPRSAPNAVAILPGTDPVLRNQYIVFSAHMDHLGVAAAQGGDSIWNGADDDASGSAGVLVLAEAFARAPVKRSLIFLTVSGEEKGLWGSEWFTSHPPVPISQIVADLNLDMIGRNWRDTIVAIGKEHSDLGATLERVNAAHPELGMQAVDDQWPREDFYSRSDHFNFARRGVPILFFFSGTHRDYHQPSDAPEKIDAEKEARVVRLVYWLGQAIGNAREKPKWNPDSYRRIVK